MTTKIRFSFFSIVFLTLILLLSWTKIGQEESEPKFNLRILPDDLKIVDFDSESGEKWTLGEIRRSPLKQKFHNVSVENLPKLMDFKIYNSDLIGTINRTKNEASVLFYNRVPKTASSTMQNLLCLQSDSLNFSFVKSDFYWQRANSVKSEIELILLLKNLTQYTIYDQHSYFINIKRYDLEFVVNWINIARDPIERFISDFYYNRQKERWQETSEKPSTKWFEKDLSECILQQDPECNFSSQYFQEQQLTYFCGSAPECRQFGSQKALNVAKSNAELYYSVIGITEHLRISFAVFEKFLPKYFTGLLRLYGQQQFLNQANDRVTTNKKPILPEARAILEKNLSKDMEFYDFLLQRLFNQANKCGILPS